MCADHADPAPIEIARGIALPPLAPLDEPRARMNPQQIEEIRQATSERSRGLFFLLPPHSPLGLSKVYS